MLADMHVTGKIRWDAYEQAKHVHTLYNVHGKTYDWLATHLRLSKSRITQDLKAFGWTTDYLKQHPDPKNVEKFSFFQEVARKKDLADRYTNDLQFQQRFNGWLTDGKLTDSKHVRRLETILSNAEATKVLGEDGFIAAAGVLIKADPALGSELYDSLKRATEKLQKAPADEVLDLANNKQKVMMLRNLRTAVDNFATLAGVTL